MKKISYLAMLVMVMAPMIANGANRDRKMQREIKRGLDIVGADAHLDTPDVAPGELGADVYGTLGASDAASRMFIPTAMYVRMGGGLNFGPMTDSVKLNGNTHDARGGYAVHLGLGWNLSSFVRTELDFMTTTLKFTDLDDRYQATYNTAGAMLYFDLVRRYTTDGDITHRRRVVPFIGVGAGVGMYEFPGATGTDGIAIAAPRAAFGVAIRVTELLNVDIAYQYGLMIGNGYGWDNPSSGTASVSNIIASVRAEF